MSRKVWDGTSWVTVGGAGGAPSSVEQIDDIGDATAPDVVYLLCSAGTPGSPELLVTAGGPVTEIHAGGQKLWDQTVPIVGGVVTDSGGYRYHSFLSPDVVIVGASTTVDVLIVGGGGGGGGTNGGGGGSGGTGIVIIRYPI